MSTPDLSTSKNHTTESLEKSCGECCGSTLPKAVCCWRSSHSIHAQKLIVRVGGVLSQLPWVLDSDKVLSPLRSLYELDRQSQPSGRWCR